MTEPLEKIREDVAALGMAEKPYCETAMYSGIRHLQRNCDTECSAEGHEWGGDHEVDCHQPDRYDGDAMARVLNAVPALLAEIDRLFLELVALDDRADI